MDDGWGELLCANALAIVLLSALTRVIGLEMLAGSLGFYFDSLINLMKMDQNCF